MKILLVVDQFEDGGAARVACTMCNEFNARGYDIQVVSSSKRESVKYDLERKYPSYMRLLDQHGETAYPAFLLCSSRQNIYESTSKR